MTGSELPSTTKLVLFVIAEYANGMDDICWPSIETIAEKASLSERCVNNHLGVAEQNGWLARWKSRRPTRRWAHAHYRLSIPADIARQQRDAIDFDLVAGADEVSGDSEPSSKDAQETGSLEPRSGNSAEFDEQRSKTALPGAVPAPGEQSYRNDVLTSKPINRNTSKPSLIQPLAVNEGKDVQREKPDESAISLAQWMLERIRARLHDFPSPDIDDWARDVEAMQSTEGHAMQDIVRMFAWADRDKFWAKVITSPARLRKNWEELRRRRNDALTSRPASATSQAVSVADDRVCAHVENGCRCVHAASTIIGAGSSRRGYCRQHIGQYED
ncbi:helix-turn-helix domain-containing protein [Burkholderia sp. R-69980]|nr:helix-turn-helix domain-containing protein [Burkholderia sp. R-69980]